MSGRGLRTAPIEPLTNQAWLRVEGAVFSRLDAGMVVPMLPYPPHASPGASRPSALRWSWAFGMAAAVAASASASIVHFARSPVPERVPSVAARARGVEATPTFLPEPAAPLVEVPVPALAPARPAPPTVAALALRSAPPVTSSAAASRAASRDGLRVATGRETRGIAVGDSRFTLSEHSEMLARGNDADGWQIELGRGHVDFDVAPRRDRPPFVIHSGDVTVRVLGTRFSVRRQEESTEVRVQRGSVEVEHEGHSARLRPGDVWVDGARVGTDTAPQAGSAASASRPQKSRTESSVAESAAAESAAADRESRFDRAASLESEDSDEALALYLSLASGDDAWAANALYAAARLELDRGNRSAGVRLLADYVERFPEGENSVDVEALRAQLGVSPP